MTTKKIYLIKNPDEQPVGVCVTESLAIEIALLINGDFEKITLIMADGEEFLLANCSAAILL